MSTGDYEPKNGEFTTTITTPSGHTVTSTRKREGGSGPHSRHQADQTITVAFENDGSTLTSIIATSSFGSLRGMDSFHKDSIQIVNRDGSTIIKRSYEQQTMNLPPEMGGSGANYAHSGASVADVRAALQVLAVKHERITNVDQFMELVGMAGSLVLSVDYENAAIDEANAEAEEDQEEDQEQEQEVTKAEAKGDDDDDDF